MDKRQVDFLLEGPTEGQYRYAEIDTGAPMAIGMIFVRKHVFDGKPPSRIVVTIGPLPDEETAAAT